MKLKIFILLSLIFYPIAISAQEANMSIQTLTESEIILLQNLSKRRQELDVREAELDLREAAIIAKEKELFTQAEKKNIQPRDTDVKEQAKTLSLMSPKDAGKIISEMESSTAALILKQLPPAQRSAILGKTETQKAAELLDKIGQM